MVKNKKRASTDSLIVLSLTLILSFFITSSLSQGVDHAASRTLKKVPEVHCSRERSRAVWKIVGDYLMPSVERKKFQLSNKCTLHPSNDIFRDQEDHKIHVDEIEWQCGYCKKTFRAEKYLDQHFDYRHSNLLNVSHGKCLADLCGALHCDFVINAINVKSPKSKCNPAASARNLHLCEDLAASCFPVNDGPSASQLHEFFLRQFCDAHTCSKRRKPFAGGGKKHRSILYFATAILIMMFLPIFYLMVYLYQRELRTKPQQLKRIPKLGRKPKPS